jgi:predicted HicB family RNase H-like nuclease
MEYKGYRGVVEFEDDRLFGRVVGIRDVITFEGQSVKEITKAFHDSVDDYLEFCKERGEEPEKSFSGKFVLRISSELHMLLVTHAFMKDISLNSFIIQLLEEGIKDYD